MHGWPSEPGDAVEFECPCDEEKGEAHQEEADAAVARPGRFTLLAMGTSWWHEPSVLSVLFSGAEY